METAMIGNYMRLSVAALAVDERKKKREREREREGRVEQNGAEACIALPLTSRGGSNYFVTMQR
jgi:hypothetical protein